MEKNLYTEGGEYLLDGIDYIGWYNIFMDGKPYTNRTFDDTSRLLSVVPLELRQYRSASSLNIGSDPVHVTPQPKPVDYDRGWFLRYFAQRVNDISAEIYEIDEAQYNRITARNPSINYQLYNAVNLRWKISGVKYDIIDITGRLIEAGVVDTNRRCVLFAEKEMPGLKFKLVDLEQFYHDGDKFADAYST